MEPAEDAAQRIVEDSLLSRSVQRQNRRVEAQSTIPTFERGTPRMMEPITESHTRVQSQTL